MPLPWWGRVPSGDCQLCVRPRRHHRSASAASDRVWFNSLTVKGNQKSGEDWHVDVYTCFRGCRHHWASTRETPHAPTYLGSKKVRLYCEVVVGLGSDEICDLDQRTSRCVSFGSNAGEKGVGFPPRMAAVKRSALGGPRSFAAPPHHANLLRQHNAHTRKLARRNLPHEIELIHRSVLYCEIWDERGHNPRFTAWFCPYPNTRKP